MSKGSVSFGDNLKYSVNIIRDTAGGQSLVLKSAVPVTEKSHTGEKVYLKDFHDPFPLPLARVHLDSPMVNGEVIIGVSSNQSLPIPNSEFLLANDLAGGAVFPPLVIKDSPLPYNPTRELERERPNLFPVCAVTRAQAAQNNPVAV